MKIPFKKSTPHIVKLQDVTKIYQSGKIRIKVRAIDHVSLEIKGGEFVVVSGPSGSGKTTLLNVIGCLTGVTSGTLFIDGREVSHWPDHFLSGLRREKIGFVFQQFNLLTGYKTWENVSLPLVPMGISENIRRGRAMTLLEYLNLETRADFMVNELSGGEQQRVAIARALINDPDIILADEPLSNIGKDHVKIVIDLFKRLKEKGKTIIISAHDPYKLKDKMVDRIIYFDAGSICF